MAKWVVAKGNSMLDETVEADYAEVRESGALEFTNRPPDGEPYQLVYAFAPGRWVEVLRKKDSAEQVCPYRERTGSHDWVSAYGGPDGDAYMGYNHCGVCGVKQQ